MMPIWFVVCSLADRSTLVYIGTMGSLWGSNGDIHIEWRTWEISSKVACDGVLSGDPGCFDNFMVLLAQYDGLSDQNFIPLQTVEVWIQLKNLPTSLKSRLELTRQFPPNTWYLTRPIL